jgi:hypothetical protein
MPGRTSVSGGGGGDAQKATLTGSTTAAAALTGAGTPKPPLPRVALLSKRPAGFHAGLDTQLLAMRMTAATLLSNSYVSMNVVPDMRQARASSARPEAGRRAMYGVLSR